MTRLVENMGMVWRVSDRSYRKLLRAIACDEPWDMDSLGKYLGTVERVSDLSAEEADDRLNEYVST
jgi:hypothetical protein